MDKIKHKYMNPITFEAEMFVNNLESLSTTYNNFDSVLVSSLEKVMNAIEKFLDSNPSEILATENTKLVECENINHIKRIYHCTRCKTDLGKSVEKVTLHLIEQCAQHGSSEAAAAIGGGSNETNSIKDAKNRDRKNSKHAQIQDWRREKRINQDIKLTKKTRSLLTTDLNQFFEDHDKIGQKLKCLPDYNVIEKDLLTLIEPLFPNKSIKIYKFGSRLAGIGTRESDLDLFIDIGETFNVFQNRADDKTVNKLRRVANAFLNHRRSWKGLVQVDKARVPILKVIHAHTSIECDINFSNSLGIINTKLLDYIFTLQPVACLLSIFIKKWSNRTSLNNEMSTYSLILMVIYYLQTEAVLPSIRQLQENINEEKALSVGPWVCMYATMTLNELNIPLEETDQPNLLKYIRGFFTFYTTFKFEKDAVCPYLGIFVQKVDVEKLMPNRYTEYVKSSADFALQLDKPMVVQDPLQLNHNVTKGLSAFTLKVFKTFMFKSLEVINETFLF